MEHKKHFEIVPEQEEGRIIDSEESIELEDDEQARKFFVVVKDRLLHVHRWHELAGELSASFKLFDQNGEEVDRPVQKGDYFRIDIPGPGTISGEGYDWVQVEEVQKMADEESESMGFRVRPAGSPHNGGSDIAHFYSHQSTSTFLVVRRKNTITAGVYDRNIEPNKNADNLADKIRDTVVGTGAAISFSKLQWKALAEGLLKKE